MKKEKTNLAWRQQPRGCPYDDDVLNDKKYLKDRAELFRDSGNGWWWIPPSKQQKRKRL